MSTGPNSNGVGKASAPERPSSDCEKCDTFRKAIGMERAVNADAKQKIDDQALRIQSLRDVLADTYNALTFAWSAGRFPNDVIPAKLAQRQKAALQEPCREELRREQSH